VAHPTSRGGEDGLIGLQVISIQPTDQLLLIPTGSVAPNDLEFPFYWGLENSGPAVFMAKMFSLDDLVQSLLEIGVSGPFNFNWPVVGHAGDSERRGFPFPIVLLGRRTSSTRRPGWPNGPGAARIGRCGRSYPLLGLPLMMPKQGPWTPGTTSFGLIPLQNLLRAFLRMHNQG
jgi:hypothetical protein